jgi:hypothetical protein
LCWNYDQRLILLHVISDSLIALAYFAIPAALFYLAHKHRVKRVSGVFTIYGAFILGCGLTHLFDVITVYKGGWVFWLDGFIRAATGVVSVMAAYVTVRCMGQALVGLTRMAVLERRLAERVEELSSRVEPSEQEARKVLTEVHGLMRSVLNEVRT